MKHLSEEELIEHHYGEGNSGAARHLEVCTQCAEAYAALGHDLAQLQALETPARNALYGEQVWHSLASSLPAYAMRRRRWPRVGLWKAVDYAAVCALLVLGAFLAGRQWQQKKSPLSAARNDSQSRQHVVLVVLGDHLDRSERLLVELKHVDASSSDTLSPMREEAMNLLASNRECLQSAAQIDDPVLAKSLDQLGRVLAELVNEPGGVSGSTITRLHNEMNTDGLLFEIRVLRSRVPDRQPGGVIQSNGGTI
jgi:hypothetical protein